MKHFIHINTHLLYLKTFLIYQCLLVLFCTVVDILLGVEINYYNLA